MGLRALKPEAKWCLGNPRDPAPTTEITPETSALDFHLEARAQDVITGHPLSHLPASQALVLWVLSLGPCKE